MYIKYNKANKILNLPMWGDGAGQFYTKSFLLDCFLFPCMEEEFFLLKLGRCVFLTFTLTLPA